MSDRCYQNFTKYVLTLPSKTVIQPKELQSLNRLYTMIAGGDFMFCKFLTIRNGTVGDFERYTIEYYLYQSSRVFSIRSWRKDFYDATSKKKKIKLKI